MLWIPDPLTTITQQLRGPLQLREQYTGADVLVVSAGYWYIYRTSLEEYLEGLKNLTAAATEALGSRTTVVLVSVPSGWMNFGYRIRPRIEAWNEAAARVASAAGWIVVDAFHLSDARPEKTDGTHIGNDTDRTNMQGGPTLSKSVANMLLGALCGSNGNGAAPIGPMEKPMAATLPIEWPNWPSSRRYVSRDALMRAKGRSTAPQMETTERVASDPKSGKARERVSSLPKPRIIMLGGQDHAAGLGGGKHSRKGRPAHHGN